jgi:hypothetical protein
LEAHDFCTAGKVLSPVTGVPNDSFAGHVNWFPVTVEGSLSFSGFEKYGDDDYDFSLVTLYDCISSPAANCGGSLYTNDPGRNFLHVEFDSDETVDHFASQEWQMAKAAVESGNKDDINKYLKGYTIMTGMFGLDGEHGLKSEIHPIYAMATREENSEIGPSDEVWLMFVRNLGDEGFCSSHIWSSGFTDYTFRLPWRDGMTSVTVDWSKSPFDASEGTTATPTVQVVPPGSGLPAPVAGGVQQSGKTSPVVGSGIVGVQKAVSKTAPVAGQSKSGSSGAAPTIAGVDKSVLKGTPILGVNNPVGSAGALDPSRTANANVGVYVTFHLGPSILPPQGISGTPASTPYIDGALHLVWSGPSSAVGPISAGNLKAPAAIASKTVTTTAKAAPAMTAKTAPPVVAKIPLPVIGSTTAPEDANEIEQKIAAAIEHLSPAQKTTVLKARVLPLVTHPATSGNSVQILKPPPAAGVTAVKTGAHQPVAGSSGVAVEKLVRDAALVHALCAATNNAPFGLPPEICKSDAPK